MGIARACALSILATLAGALVAQDYGDAPASYGLASAGSTMPERLGTRWNNKATNPVTPAWIGDPDDDGVVGNPVWQAGASNNSVSVVVSTGGYVQYLAMFVDLNDDGDWDDTGERFDHPAFPTNSSGTYTFDNIALPPITYSRNGQNKVAVRFILRYHSAISGPADHFSYGEIEDYLFDVTPAGFGIVTHPDLPPAAEGVAYSQDIEAANGSPPYTWSMTGGTLPSGLSFAQVGDAYRLSGTPGPGTGGSTYNFTVQVNGTIGSVSRQFTLRVADPPATLPYVQDFNANSGYTDGWRATGMHAALWQWGPPASSGLTAGHSGPNVWATNLTGNYNVDNAEAYLVSPVINLTGAVQPGLSFFHHMNSEGPTYAWDGGTVQFRVNGGAWRVPDQNDPGWLQNGPNSASVTALNAPGWYGMPWSGWRETVVDLYQLTSFSVNPGDTLQVRFWFGSDHVVSNYPGWYIDMFRVRELPARNRLIVSDFEIQSPWALGSAQTPNVYTGTQSDFELTVDNVTPNPIEVTSFNVYVVRFGANQPETVGTFSLTLSIPLMVPAFNNGIILTGQFDCTTLASTGDGTLLTARVVLEGIEQNSGILVEGDKTTQFYVSQGPPPPPPQMRVHESDFQGATVSHDQPAVGTGRDRGQVSVGGTPGSWLNIVILNFTAADMDVFLPVLAGPDADSFQLDTSQFTANPMTLTTSGSTRQVFFSVRLRPYAVGNLDAWVEFTHTAPEPPFTPFRVNFTGEGVGAPPALQVHEALFSGPQVHNGDSAAMSLRDFGAAAAGGTSAWLNIVLWNRFRTDTTIDPAPSLIGPDAADFEIFFFPGEIQATGPYIIDGSPGLVETTAFALRFRPQASGAPGPRQAHVVFGHDASNPTGTPLGGGFHEFSFEVIGEVAGPDAAVHVSEVDVPQGARTANVFNGAPALNDRDFGERDIAHGQTSWVTIRVANPGGSTMTLGTPALVAGDTGEFVLQTGTPYNFSQSVVAGGYTEFGVAFHPSTVGTKVATIAFDHDGVNTATPFEFEVMGHGKVTAAEIEIRENNDSGPVVGYNSPALGTGRDFGNVDVAAGPTAPLVIRIENTGNVDMQLGQPVFTVSSQTPSAFALDSSGMLTLLRPGTATTFTVRFTPNSHGMKSATIELPHDASNEFSPFLIPVRGFADAPVISVREGSGQGVPLIHDAPASGMRDFGSMELSLMPSAPVQISITNMGSANLNLNMPTLTGPHFNQFSLHAQTMPLNLTPGQVVTFEVRFSATQVGIKEAQINIGHNDPSGPSPFIVRLHGVGTDPGGVRVTSPVDFATGRVDQNFGPVQLEAEGGTPSYFWSLRQGEVLPAGLFMSIFGVITGRPEGPAGHYEFKVRVTDSLGGTNDKILRMTILRRAGESINRGESSGNCAATGSRVWPPAALFTLLLASAWLRRRRATA